MNFIKEKSRQEIQAKIKKAEIEQKQKEAAAAAYMARAQRTADRRDPGQGNTVTGFGKSGLGRDPNDRMAQGGIIGLKR